jgi:hypothetical protein
MEGPSIEIEICANPKPGFLRKPGLGFVGTYSLK